MKWLPFDQKMLSINFLLLMHGNVAIQAGRQTFSQVCSQEARMVHTCICFTNIHNYKSNSPKDIRSISVK